MEYTVIYGSHIVILFLLVLMVVLKPIAAASDRVRAELDAKELERAQAMEIADNVTLLQAVRAYCGEDGKWLPCGGTVYMWTGTPKIFTRVELKWVDKETSILTLDTLMYEEKHLNQEEIAALLHEMAQSVNH